MYKLKLIKARSYSMGAIYATKQSPYCTTDDKDLATKAVDSGYFVLETTEHVEAPVVIEDIPIAKGRKKDIPIVSDATIDFGEEG